MMYYMWAISGDPKSPDYMVPEMVYRVGDNWSITQRWDDGEWVDDNYVMEATGHGGDSGNFYRMTEEKAMAFIENDLRKPGPQNVLEYNTRGAARCRKAISPLPAPGSAARRSRSG